MPGPVSMSALSIVLACLIDELVENRLVRWITPYATDLYAHHHSTKSESFSAQVLCWPSLSRRQLFREIKTMVKIVGMDRNDSDTSTKSIQLRSSPRKAWSNVRTRTDSFVFFLFFLAFSLCLHLIYTSRRQEEKQIHKKKKETKTEYIG